LPAIILKFNALSIICNPQINENTWLEQVNDDAYKEVVGE